MNTNGVEGLGPLGDPTRRAIFELLARHPRTVGELAQQLPITRSAVSQHLRVLKDGYTRAAVYAVIGAAGLALVTFRAVGPALLALVPLGLGAVWTLGSSSAEPTAPAASTSSTPTA